MNGNLWDGFDLVPAQLAVVMSVPVEEINGWMSGGLAILLKSTSTNPTVEKAIRSREFRNVATRYIDFIEEDTTMRTLSDDLGIPTDIVAWSFFEAAARWIKVKHAQEMKVN